MNGLYVIRKEKGWTSFDVVARLRTLTKERKIGHTGTLDPDAEGVLVICLGKATKIIDTMEADTKTYRCTAKLGVTTDTQDLTGTVLSENPVTVSEKEVEEALYGLTGWVDQVPPMYSALKVNGRRLYELAREGKEVERKVRRVRFYDLFIDAIDLPYVSFTVSCTKGAYLRTFCHDLGMRLGCGGAMRSLLRTRCGRFCLEQAVTIRELEEDPSLLERERIPLDDYYKDLPAVRPGATFDKAIKNGNSFRLEEDHRDAGDVRVYTSDGCLAGIYRYEKKTDRFELVKYFYEDPERSCKLK